MTPTGYVQVAEEVVNGAVMAQYTYGRVRISQKRSGVLSYYGYDGGGSVRQLLDQTGAIMDTYAYDAFGNTIAQTGSTVNEFLYRGEFSDSTLSLYYLRARYYEPLDGRFTQIDPLAPACGPAGIPEAYYVYSKADPVNLVDPSGKQVLVDTAEQDSLITTALKATVALAISALAVCVLEATGSLLEAVVSGITGGFDFTLEKQDGVNCFFAKKKNSGCWTCKANCNIQIYSEGGNTITGPEASGSGPTETAACQAAKDAASALSPAGSYTRHCKCYDCERS